MEKSGPMITTQPKGGAYAKNEMMTLTIKASGEGLKYQWYRKNPGNSKFVKASATSAKTDTFLNKMNATRDGMQVYCVVTDKNGNSVQSKTITVTMEAASLKITTQPKGGAYAKNEMMTLTIKASGEGLKYQWYCKNPGDSKFVKAKAASGTTDTFLNKMNATRNGMQVYCVVTDKYGKTVKSKTITVTMK